jgi:(E)-4-hydroxy-3-methylbut-2-enyl-diphosphate synthase
MTFLSLPLAAQVLYKKLGCKLAVGMPFKDIATTDSILVRNPPPSSDKNARLAIKRLQVRGATVCGEVADKGSEREANM